MVCWISWFTRDKFNCVNKFLWKSIHHRNWLNIVRHIQTSQFIDPDFVQDFHSWCNYYGEMWRSSTQSKQNKKKRVNDFLWKSIHHRNWLKIVRHIQTSQSRFCASFSQFVQLLLWDVKIIYSIHSASPVSALYSMNLSYNVESTMDKISKVKRCQITLLSIFSLDVWVASDYAHFLW